MLLLYLYFLHLVREYFKSNYNRCLSKWAEVCLRNGRSKAWRWRPRSSSLRGRADPKIFGFPRTRFGRQAGIDLREAEGEVFVRRHHSKSGGKSNVRSSSHFTRFVECLIIELFIIWWYPMYLTTLFKHLNIIFTRKHLNSKPVVWIFDWNILQSHSYMLS